MEKHLLISKGCKGWGGPLTITPGQGKKIALYNFRGHLNTQSFGNTLDITLLCFCIAAGHKKPSVA